MTGLTVLSENSPGPPGTREEHGLSVLVRHTDATILWDTGASSLLLENARALGVSLDSLDAIALSHGHYDHTGGLDALCAAQPGCRVYAHPGMFQARYSRARTHGAPPRYIGAPCSREELAAACGDLMLSESPTEVAPGVHLTGEIPRDTTFEDTGGAFFVDEACTRPDPLIDDQTLVLETEAGLAVVTGCCHSGIINTLEHIAALFNTRRFALIMGGFHLVNADGSRIERTIDMLKEYDWGMLAPGHCTGSRATEAFQDAFPGRVSPLSVGWEWADGDR